VAWIAAIGDRLPPSGAGASPTAPYLAQSSQNHGWTLRVLFLNFDFRRETIRRFYAKFSEHGLTATPWRTATEAVRYKRDRMRRVIDERAASADFAAVPGGASGLLCRDY
jgi:hypothetical protein